MTTNDSSDYLKNVPLVVEIDESLLMTDLLLENLWAALGKNFFATLMVVMISIWSTGRLNQRLRTIAMPELGLLPVRTSVLDLARRAALSGQPVILTSRANQSLVDGLAGHLALPGEHFGSDQGRSLTRANRAALLVEKLGEGGFDYVGSPRSSLKIWPIARRIVVVAPGPRLSARIAEFGKPVQIIGNEWRFSSLIREMRPYQWVKNLLLLLPLFAAHDFSGDHLFSVLVSIAAFCATTSAVYLVNDMLDLTSDRQHPEKKKRPIAAGALPLDVAMRTSLGLGAAGLLIGWLVNWEVVGFLIAYLAVSFAYSLFLKRLKWVDLFVLASLYTLRVLTGAAAVGSGISGWLIAFCFAVFFSLSAVKRLTALARASNEKMLPGRGYARVDLNPLLVLSGTGSLAAPLLFLFYTFSAPLAALYSNLDILRLATVPIAVWLFRMVLLGRMGKEDYDPLVFVEHDKIGLAIIAVGLTLVAAAI